MSVFLKESDFITSYIYAPSCIQWVHFSQDPYLKWPESTLVQTVNPYLFTIRTFTKCVISKKYKLSVFCFVQNYNNKLRSLLYNRTEYF